MIITINLISFIIYALIGLSVLIFGFKPVDSHIRKTEDLSITFKFYDLILALLWPITLIFVFCYYLYHKK